MTPRPSPKDNFPSKKNRAPKEFVPLFERIDAILNHFRQFGWDLLGTFLILLAILTSLGLLGLSRGTLINSWITLIRRAFGLGSYLLVLVLVFVGVSVFRHAAGKRFPLSIGKVLAIEGMLLVLLPILAFTGNVSIERAYDGLDGGTFGWGLAQLLIPLISKPLTLLFYLFLFFVFAGLSTGFFPRLLEKARAWSRSTKISKSEKPGLARKAAGENFEKTKPSSLVSWRDAALPPMSLLLNDQINPPDQVLIKDNARLIEEKLAEFGVPVKVLGFRVGPAVTQYAVEPGYTERKGADGVVTRQKVKVAKITSLQDDLKLALSAQRLRIESPVPGRSYVGIEVPNEDNLFVRLRPILESETFRKKKSPLLLALGRDVSGEPIQVDLEKLPHLLIAGTTNSGKSVCVTSLAACLAMNNTPDNLRLVMLDPKMVELVRFNGLPHLIGKVETEIDRMLAALRWAQMEMDSRYRRMAEVHARNLDTFNQKMLQKKRTPLPRIVIFIDELADLMINAPEQTEHSLIRLAQMARATGIHLVVATQRPSTDVVTGLIKANFPARISFAMASAVDSRVILDANGAETLLGKGDMLLLDPVRSGLQRLQGVIVSDGEIEKIMEYWQSAVHEEVGAPPWEGLVDNRENEGVDALLERATTIVRETGKASTSLLQRRLRIGFPRAARLIDELEEMGVIGPAVGSGKEREVLEVEEEEPESEEDEA
jgi:S-DNA-T family DNA segregation ATPase FtsK/SpoIIIE